MSRECREEHFAGVYWKTSTYHVFEYVNSCSVHVCTCRKENRVRKIIDLPRNRGAAGIGFFTLRFSFGFARGTESCDVKVEKYCTGTLRLESRGLLCLPPPLLCRFG